MALINCPECGYQMSDTTNKCPNCGWKETNIKIIIFSIIAFIGAAITLVMCFTDAVYDLQHGHLGYCTCFILSGLLAIFCGFLIFRNSKKRGKVISGIIFILYLCGFLYVSTLIIIQMFKHSNYETSVLESPLPQQLETVTTINEFENLINGTTWHFTEILDYTDIPCWFKVTFENGSYKTYYANPSEGHWTYGGSGKYKIEESRYSNTGEKYFVVSWDGKMSIKKGIGDIACSLALTQNREFFVQPFVGSTMRGKMEYGDYEWK